MNASQLAERFVDWLGTETQAADTGEGRVMLLTPAEYPDCDAVGVYVELRPDGEYVVTDMAEADSRLIGHLNPGAAANKARAIAGRFDVEFDGGRVVARVAESDLPEACWRVAQASAAIAEAATSIPPQVPTPRPFERVVVESLRQRDVEVQTAHRLRGLSGHEHVTSVYVPATHTVLEPITGRKAWDRATKVYATFGDLRETNGFRLVAVLDDRDGQMDHEANLLSQVGQVATWSRHNEWLETFVRPARGGRTNPFMRPKTS